jgi:hypothetical protein
MSDQPTIRRPMRPDDIPTKHSGQCDMSSWTRRPCTCGAGLLWLLAGRA